ncbi:hypothetical protein TSUD_136520 [Trifolium subterraneum]|uniref:Uncharacterized protein n=1 Tax=Trifolium subterraneum TaxID=3900 RepID=A0A2Z6NWU5_TRISU|nr:hypothetical protein TSUD_136520 [Trifolium subterraneum]
MDREGGYVTRPPLLDDSNYDIWKARMIAFLKSMDSRTWKAVLKGWEHPKVKNANGADTDALKPEEEWTAAEDSLALGNSKALNALFNGVDKNMFRLIKKCEVAKDAWEILKTTQEGTAKVKISRLQNLTRKFENLRMKEDESVHNFYMNVMDFANSFEDLGEKLSDEKIVRKILRSLTKKFDMKVIAMEEAQDISTMKVDELIGSLQTYESSVNERIEKKNKSIAFVSNADDEDLESDIESTDSVSEAIVLLGRQFNKVLKRMDRRPRQNARHLATDMSRNIGNSRKTKIDEKPAQKEEGESEVAKHVTVLTGIVTSDTESCDEEVSYDELAETYRDLCLVSEEKCKELEKQKKLNSQLQGEKISLLSKVNSLTSDLDAANEEIDKLEVDIGRLRKSANRKSRHTPHHRGEETVILLPSTHDRRANRPAHQITACPTRHGGKALKAQVLADFMAEVTCSPSSTDGANKWTIFVDGASNATGAGARIILENEEGILIEVSLALSFPTSNNQVEYEAFLAGLRLAEDVSAKEIKIYTDSQLVASHVLGEYQAKNDNLSEDLALVKERITKHEKKERKQICNPGNPLPSEHTKTNEAPRHKRHRGHNYWMTPVYNYLAHGTLPNDEKEAATVKRRSWSYTILDNKLYRRGFSIPLLKCADEATADYILREIHEGINSQRLGGRSLARKALRAGYYWPTMQQDAKEHSLSSPWPFTWWGMDILGPFTRGNLQCRYLIVGVDYFTKWVEAEPLPEITSFRILRFFKRDIICRCGIPQAVVTDNGTQFTDETFRGFLAKINTKHHFTSVEHPQTNGQAEAANRVILRGLRRRLGDAKKQWVEELPHVLWAYRTTPHSTTGETPFRLAYGTEAVIPVEIGEPSRRTEAPLDEQMNDDAMREELNLVEEIQTAASLKEASLKQLVAAQHDTKVIKRDLEVGSIVLRRNAKDSHEGKLAANWEGPYRVRGKTDNGAYHLETL